MADCPNLEDCPFFNGFMAGRPDIASDILKVRFCMGNNAACARWRVASELGGGHVPDDMYPNQENRANAILNEAKEAVLR